MVMSLVSVAKTLGAVEGCGGPGCHRVFGVLDMAVGSLAPMVTSLVSMAMPIWAVGAGADVGDGCSGGQWVQREQQMQFGP